MEHRAYSILTIKTLDDDQRIIQGIATTPTTDRMGDVIEPLGASFSLPLPLLWQHRADEPIGHVVEAKVREDGISFRAQLAKIAEPGPLKETVDRAWQAIKAGLVRGISVGFRALDDGVELLKNGGLRFKAWEWLELSAVTIPANSEATITGIKAAANGEPNQKAPAPRAPVKLIKPKKPGVSTMKNVADQIKDFEATRAAKVAEREAVQQKAADEGRSKDESEKEQFDTLTDEIRAIDAELKDLRVLEKEMVEEAKVVDTGAAAAKAAVTRDPTKVVVREEKLDKGIEFARFAMCLAAAKGQPREAYELARNHYPNMARIQNVLGAALKSGRSQFNTYIENLYKKDNIEAGTTDGETWAAPLVEYNQFAGDFVEYLRPMTIIGKFGMNGIPALRMIPFNVHIRAQQTGSTGYWVGEGKPKPVTKGGYADVNHQWNKVAAISVLTDELIRFSNPSAERLVRDDLAEALVARIDTTFIDPDEAVSAGVSPASITNGLVAIASSGDDGDAVRADINSLWADAIAANLPLTNAVYITTPSIALATSLMTNALGQREFPEMTMMGGRLLGVPTIVSNHVPAGVFVLAFASEIWLSDDGQVAVDASREASIQMLDNPTNDSDTPTPTTLVSMFQTNSVALRAERYITWTKRRSTAVAYLNSVGWGGALES